MSGKRLTIVARGSWPLLKSCWRILAGTCDCTLQPNGIELSAFVTTAGYLSRVLQLQN